MLGCAAYVYEGVYSITRVTVIELGVLFIGCLLRMGAYCTVYHMVLSHGIDVPLLR